MSCTTLGFFGGTFNPVHFGHLRLALEVKQALELDEVRLVPCHRPAHRGEPEVSDAQRAAMLRLALSDCADLQLDTRELERSGPSYSVDTLQGLREELGPETSLSWIMGSDAFAGLDTWHRWRELLDWGHIVVVARPGWKLPETGPVADCLTRHQGPAEVLSEKPAGHIVVQSLRLLPISATDIRTQIAAGESPQFLLPDSVWQFIQQHGLYARAAP
ncbi:nicotinate-nucleotide adenylyltransferase [Marinimicrobium sp. ABcell2]|uniref:nicotinate-nucleotide adenylyltransferase n=1 Tax=Marinimicrobium sp. ABcell2 TaxID=3069751 RepID=UPI0027B17E77|nr:nicotinate-nucleotide adenylyltransferase [Marinimicrobium sp. ABcell2]MDQ2076284.1 nicotinate-nucleotide adenylyltransferase [Marinimicrobium sp. ABcell2]